MIVSGPAPERAAALRQSPWDEGRARCRLYSPPPRGPSVLCLAWKALIAGKRSGDQIRSQGTKASKNTAKKDALMAMSVGMSLSFTPQR
jgi:hypothetical protein